MQEGARRSSPGRGTCGPAPAFFDLYSESDLVESSLAQGASFSVTIAGNDGKHFWGSFQGKLCDSASVQCDEYKSGLFATTLP